jgi:hypothetical protein
MFEQCGLTKQLDADDRRRTNSVACLRLVPGALRSRTMC